MEFLDYVSFGIYDNQNDHFVRQKVLALFQMKYQLEEVNKMTGRRVFMIVEKLWYKYSLPIHLIQWALDLDYKFYGLRKNEDELFFEADGKNRFPTGEFVENNSVSHLFRDFGVGFIYYYGSFKGV